MTTKDEALRMGGDSGQQAFEAMRERSRHTKDSLIAEKMRYLKALLIACGGDEEKAKAAMQKADGTTLAAIDEALAQPTPTPELPPLPDEREAFETWFLQKGSAHQLERNRSRGWYENIWANAGWAAWEARAALAQRSAKPHQGCACRWNGDEVIAQCEVHAGWREAIHEWAERAKDAEKKLTALTEAAQQFVDDHPNGMNDDPLFIELRDAAYGTAAPDGEPKCQDTTALTEAARLGLEALKRSKPKEWDSSAQVAHDATIAALSAALPAHQKEGGQQG